MTLYFPVVELVDRFVIAHLKFDRTQANQEELDWYTNQMKEYDTVLVDNELKQLYVIHNQIWELESELKSGKEHKLSLEEIGRRAIEIRNWNKKRIALKNSMAEKLNCSVREIKQDHLSQ
jgi:hypothetical protein